MTATPRAVGPRANVGNMAPKSATARRGATVGAAFAPDSDVHERVSSAHARLAVLYTEIVEVHRELAQVELDAGAGSALMERVPETSKTMVRGPSAEASPKLQRTRPDGSGQSTLVESSSSTMRASASAPGSPSSVRHSNSKTR